MVGAGNQTGAGADGDGPQPASRAGREQMIAALKAAFVQGRLSKDEFELRVGQALAIYAQLEALTADIPAAPPAVKPRSELDREAANKKMIKQGTAGAAGLVFLLDAVLVIPRYPVPGVITGVLLTCFVSVLVAGFLTLLTWAMDRRSGAGPAQASPPAYGSEATRHQGTADQQGRFPETGQDPPLTAQAARKRPLRPATSPA
jgi:Domain of unknown function (DUF1707)